MSEKMESNTSSDTLLKAETGRQEEYATIYESSPYRTSEEELEIVKDLCDANDIDIPEEDSNGWWDILNDHDRLDSEWFWDEVRQFDRKHPGKVLISGTLGLWWGHPDIKPEEADGLEAAMQRCMGRDIQDIKLYEDEKGRLFLDCCHHDGTNRFRLTGPKGGALKFRGVVWGHRYPRKRRGKAA